MVSTFFKETRVNRFVFFMILLMISFSSEACSVESDPQEPKRRCSYLEIIVHYAKENMAASVRAIEQSSNIPNSQKGFFKEQQQKFEEDMKQTCADNLECQRNKLVKRIKASKKFYCDYHKCE